MNTMSNFDRRTFLKSALASLVQAAGTVVVASTAVATAQAQSQPTSGPSPEDLQGRADRLAEDACLSEEAVDPKAWLNGVWRNTPVGSWRNSPVGGFRNTPVGSFRNTPIGGFRNGPAGGFGNGGWPNFGWGGFGNGGWPNFGWRNW
jgi:hypothetical protein